LLYWIAARDEGSEGDDQLVTAGGRALEERHTAGVEHVETATD